MIRLFLSIVSLFFASCSGETGRAQEENPGQVHEIENLTIFPADTEPVYAIELIAEQTFGDAGEPYLRNISDSRVDDKGHVLIEEQVVMDSQLHVYNPDGSYRTQVGRIGSGPGEHGFISNYSVRAGKLFVLDLGNRRLNIYDSETYTFERSINMEDWSVMEHEAVQNKIFIGIYTRDDGNHIVRFIIGFQPTLDPAYSTYMMVNSDGDVLNPEPLEIPDRFSILRDGPYFGGVSRFTLSGDGTMYAAWDDFLIKKFDARGRYQSAFYYPIKGPPLEVRSSERSMAPSSIRQQPSPEDDIEIPDRNPALGGVFADDESRIWARVRTDDQDKYEWWVLDHSGRLLARFDWPQSQDIYYIKDGYLYSGFSGAGDESPKIIRYRIELEER